jgi:hypothetical protein
LLFNATLLATIFDNRFSTIRLFVFDSFFLSRVYALFSATPKHKGEKKKSNTDKRKDDECYQINTPLSQN